MGYRFNRQRQSVNIWTFSSLVGAIPFLLLSLSSGSCSPDVLVPLDVDLVELSRDGRDQVLLHLHRHVLRQYGEQEPLLNENNIMGIH